MFRDPSYAKILRIAAIAILVGLALATIVPASARPVTGLQHDIEHGLAFMLAGFGLALAFETSMAWMLFAAVSFTLALECAQIPLPSRHARLQDFIVDSIGICLGIVLARLGKSVLPRLQN
jgi:glycopeptide antibiotics resistance protein